MGNAVEGRHTLQDTGDTYGSYIDGFEPKVICQSHHPLLRRFIIASHGYSDRSVSARRIKYNVKTDRVEGFDHTGVGNQSLDHFSGGGTFDILRQFIGTLLHGVTGIDHKSSGYIGAQADDHVFRSSIRNRKKDNFTRLSSLGLSFRAGWPRCAIQ